MTVSMNPPGSIPSRVPGINEGAAIVGGASLGDGPGPDVMAASTLEGNTVVNTQGEKLGELKEVMLDVRRGRVAYAVLAVGGLFGLGEKLFAIPWNALVLDTEEHQFVLDVDGERLKSAPGFDKDHWPTMADPTWGAEVHRFYDRQPYWG